MSGEGLAALAEGIAGCLLCDLGRLRDQEGWKSVPGHGPATCPLAIVGEGPGAEEAKRGLPFVGRAGRLLDKVLAEAGIRREAVFVTNVVKCRPPRNRAPQAAEARACQAWLAAQMELVAPEIILTLGRPAFEAVSGKKAPVSRVRGHLLEVGGQKIFPTYHPAYALRNEEGAALFRQDVRALGGWLLPRHPEVGL